ncbi:unnamed protein product [Lactuca virosa]|uniref:Riboflavin biosynthesis protein PYRD, chloroplastic n=1 Tax=Lactuca virosa TaxID=75947 RepID=A0AAU9MZY1_9ASTR|nr:unnamed protein product [Lactuca virosa]
MRRHVGLGGITCEEASLGKDDKKDNDDGFYIRRCLELARKAIGHTTPNPMVGCVIIKDGKIIGEGFHPKAGQPHAEVFALRDAGELAENSTAYVSLEPCNHFGRTPPCSEALIKAKVKKMVVGMVDLNPIVASRGVAKLQDAGIDVTVGVEEELCKKFNEAWIHQMKTGNPFVTLRSDVDPRNKKEKEIDGNVVLSGGENKKNNKNRFDVLGSIEENIFEKMDEDSVTAGQGIPGIPGDTVMDPCISDQMLVVSNLNSEKCGVGNSTVGVMPQAFEKCGSKMLQLNEVDA